MGNENAVKENTEGRKAADGKKSGGRARKYLSNLELASFAGQMALVLKAGISGIEGITLMYEDADDEGDKRILKEILDEAELTGNLAPALEKTGLFPPYMVQMTRIGERTGNLDTVMDNLEDFYENEEGIRRDSTNAVLYPLILTCIMIAVVIVLIVQVMPVFEQVFEELGTEMTGLPLALKNIGDVIRTYSVSFLLILGAIVLIVFVSRLTPEGRQFWHNFGRRFRSIRTGYEEEAAYRFASVMSMALSSGLTPEEGMDLAIDLVDELSVKERLQQVREDINGGASMTESLQEHKVFSGIYARMASLGAKTGSLDKVLAQIADLYRQDAQDRLNRRLEAVQPALVIILSVLIGAILLSVMFPLLGIMSSL